MLRSYIENSEDTFASSAGVLSNNLNRIFIVCIAFAVYIILYTIIFTLCDIYDIIHKYIEKFSTSYNKIIGENNEMVMMYKDIYLKKLKSTNTNTNTTAQTQLQHSPTYTKAYSISNSHIKKRYNIHDSDFIVPSITTTCHAMNTNDNETSSEGSRASPLPRTSKTPIFHKDHFNV